MRNAAKVFVIVLISSFMIAGSVQASTAKDYSETSFAPFTKFGRGVINVILSPLEVYYQVRKMEKANNEWISWIGGIPKGLLFFPLRLVVGAYDIVTFPIPFPKHYAPVVQPETLVEGFADL